MKGLVFFAVGGVGWVGARSLRGKYNLEQEEDDRLLYRLLEMITVLSFFHCQRVGGLVLGASEENTI